MPLSIPPELKKITPYVRRAEELDKDKANPESRLVAYYCRQYAVHAGIPLATTPPGKNCLGELLGNLEGEKTAMNSFTRDEAKFLCTKFADKIFDKADLEDRTGGSTKDTAKTFYAAASFLEILQQFYKDDDASEEIAEVKKKSVYAKWKATDILKAIKEGREPTPGGYGEQEEEGLETDDAEVENKEETEPKVETVAADESDVPEPETSPETSLRIPKPEPEPEEEEDQGTEVALGPPPAYPGADEMVPPPAAPPAVQKPPLTFNPPPIEPLMPPPQATKPTPAPAPAKKSGGIFGLGKRNKGKKSKAEIADALELAKFAVAALEDKNTDLAAERLKKALEVLNR